MEKFKAVEKEMKTKAYSKEGLQAASKLDPKEKEKQDTLDFLSEMTAELERQIESAEAEVEKLETTMKKNKKDTAKAERIAELEESVERHKWHQNKLELLQRALDNGNVEVQQVKDIEDSIRYYVDGHDDPEYMEDDTMYDDLNLQEEEVLYGMGQDADRVSSQDTHSVQDESADVEGRSSSNPGKAKAESASSSARRPSTQLKSPLPSLATLHTPMPGASSSSSNPMKPAPIPARTPGEPLKYASAAAAAAANDKNGVGIAPLPPPPGTGMAQSTLAPTGAHTSATASPAISHAQPAQRPQVSSNESSSQAQVPKPPVASAPQPTTSASDNDGRSRTISEDGHQSNKKATASERLEEDRSASATPPLTNGRSHAEDEEGEVEESVYHLPSSLQDLLDSFEATKKDIAASTSQQPDERLLTASMKTAPDTSDTEAPRHYQPQDPYPYTPSHYPQEPLSIFEDPRLYQRIETDALFYAFYYRQGTYQQYLAAKALKSQSWRFHKQYQTWFQRHEEPKSITDDYEQGTYRFFDYESTW
jgi:CCR4-NOT transcription complex subunit 3